MGTSRHRGSQMTVDEALMPPYFDDLNQQFYPEEGPGEFLRLRFNALCVIGGAYEPFKEILGEGVEFAGTRLSLADSTDDPDLSAIEADQAFQQHYLRIETHHLKHLAFETLARLFLGHRGFPECPWFEISREFDFPKFKESVETFIVNANHETLQSDVAFVILGQSRDLTTATEEVLNYSCNLARFLRSFASDWLAEAKSYNATKHGLTAIPGEANFSIGTSPDEMVEIAYGDRLAHLSTTGWKDGRRDWAVTTRWIRKEHAVPSIYIAIQMLEALWSVARVRYGISGDSGPLELVRPDFTPEKLREMECSSTTELSMPAFVEFRNPPRHTNIEPATAGDAGDATQGNNRIIGCWKRMKASQIVDRMSNGLRWLGRWVLRFVLRTIRAFLAGVGGFAIVILGLGRPAGLEQVDTGVLLGLLMAGGFVGVALQRSFKRFALLRRLGELVTLKVAVTAGTE